MRAEEVSLNFKEKAIVTGRFLKHLFLQQETIIFLLFLTPSLLFMIFTDFTIGSRVLTGFIHVLVSLGVGTVTSLCIGIVAAVGMLIYESIREDFKPFLKRLYKNEEDNFKKEILENIEREHLLK